MAQLPITIGDANGCNKYCASICQMYNRSGQTVVAMFLTKTSSSLNGENTHKKIDSLQLFCVDACAGGKKPQLINGKHPDLKTLIDI